ncbi:hypothetical protein [Subtercola lobariae]|uniref:Uncharacterized protein n=1 Tax=Subtercola lobariae TaxID=1588641 RepID=A0A917F1W8_9MICO|nr:hypothetical protein [Subtercola lobariae]GGF40301.1 hypothetical protein GCM10011399_36380 [Subtercola lobariae]
MTIELSPRALAPSVTNSVSLAGTGSLANTTLPGRTLSDAPHASDIRISILSDHEWRICDRRIPETNAESVLGYIEKTGGFFEVMRLTATRNLLYYADFEHAVESFSSTVAPVAVGRVS